MTGVRRFRFLGMAGALALGALFGAVRAEEASGASSSDAALSERLGVILVYHRFGEDSVPSTNTPYADFVAHLDFLSSDGWTVVPLESLLSALEGGAPLPPKSVVLTIDDAYRSSYEVAWPLLRERGFPFTLFVATEPLERRLRGYVSWSELSEMASDPLVTVGHHGHAHGHMVDWSPAARAADYAKADALFSRFLGEVPRILAFPFGEYSLASRSELADLGFRAALAQHSGPVGRASDRFALTRFAMSGSGTSVERLRLVLNSRPLPVRDFTPEDPALAVNPPSVRFVLDAPPALSREGAEAGLADLGRLRCYLGGEAIALSGAGGSEEASQAGRRVFSISLSAPLPAGRSRLNCTLPLGPGVWGWHGRLFYLPGGSE